MKRGIWILLLALTLTACGAQPSRESAAVPAEAPVQEEPVKEPEREAPEKPEEAAPAEPEPEEAAPEAPAPAAPELPEELANLLTQAGVAAEDIGAGQLIVVHADGNTAKVSAFEADDTGGWQTAIPAADGFVGKNGVTAEKQEGDRKTPAGLFPLTTAFGIQPDPGSGLPYRQVTAESYWVDDPASAVYNQWAEETESQDWNSAEHLADYPAQYAYGVVVDYNVNPVVPGKGSAIFLHCGSRPTMGCIALPQETVVEILKWLCPGCTPKILIF